MHMQHHYAIPSIQGPIVVKYGGNAMPDPTAGDADPTLLEIAELWRNGWSVVVVHGGGPQIDAALAQRGIVTERIDGMRVTDAETLSITEAALCATVNKRIVRALTGLGVAVAGISGQDGGTLVARPLRNDLGYVGEVTICDPTLIEVLLAAHFLPVISPLAISTCATTAMNLNADLAAGSIAGALRAAAFVAITNVRRVLRDIHDASSAIDQMTPLEARAFAADDACGNGMKPKLYAAALAVLNGAKASYICEARNDAITAALLAREATIVRSA